MSTQIINNFTGEKELYSEIFFFLLFLFHNSQYPLLSLDVERNDGFNRVRVTD